MMLGKRNLKFFHILKSKALIRKFMLLICLSVFIYSMWMIFAALYDYNVGRKVYSDIKTLYYSDSQSTKNIQSDKKLQHNTDAVPEEHTDSSNSHMDSQKNQISGGYINEDSVSDFLKDKRQGKDRFKRLLEINKDVVGWIKIPGSIIDYPVLQSKDNEFYLNHNIEGKVIRTGSIFMDYRNKIKKYDQNTILYGHHLKDNTMFRDLIKFQNKEFFGKNTIINFGTLGGYNQWEIFSVYITDTKFDYLITNFKTSKEYIKYLNTVKKKSMFTKNVELTEKDRILTLSTCSYKFKDARLVLHARLVENTD